MSIDPSTAPEVPAWVKDSDGNYYRIGGGGSTPVTEPEVFAQATQPTPTADLLWVDTSAPQPSVTVEPYVKVSGDTMTGPLVLSGAPTLLTQAGRWADGIPRFADEAARDAAYLTIGGPAQGMHCFVDDRTTSYSGLTLRWSGTEWEVIAGDTGWRNIGSLIINGWSGSVSARRIVNVGYLRGLSLANPAGPSALSVIVGTPPPGFEPAYQTFGFVALDSYEPATVSAMMHGSTGLLQMAGTYPTAGTLKGSWVFPINTGWPTILPGIPGLLDE